MSTPYILKFNPSEMGAAAKTPDQMTVSRSVYDAANPGMRFEFTTRSGFLNLAWYEVRGLVPR